jgi:hypothetical protein
MIDAKDVQRTFETWLALAKDQEVLLLADLVHRALYRRGYAVRCEWFKPVPMSQEARLRTSADSDFAQGPERAIPGRLRA